MSHDKEVIETTAKAVSDLGRLCQALLQADPEILDIVQFGSSVYAPDVAVDLDLWVTTVSKKDDDVYWDAVADWPVNVDLMVREPGQRIGDWMALGLCAAHRVLYGDGITLEEAVTAMTLPTYDEVRERLPNADQYLQNGHNAPNEFRRDGHYRTAFNALFDAARMAAMTYLATEETRWGELRRGLPRPFAGWFRRIVNTLHIAYFYNGHYPDDDVGGEFQRWRDEVTRFIDGLEALE